MTRLLLGLVPILSVPVLTLMLLHGHNFAFDFHGWYWPAGERVLRGASPYAPAGEMSFKYPAFSALLFVPFALLPHAAADVVFTIYVLVAVPATLRILGVRDWRVFGIAMLWPPVVYGWETANVTLLLVLGVAIVWRCRDCAWAVGVLIAVLVSVKLLLLPLCAWLLATRRYAALAWAALAATLINAGAWLVLGTGQVSRYVHLLRAFTAGAERRGYSLISFLLHQGIGQRAAYAVALLVALALLAGALCARRSERDQVAFISAIAACLIVSPLVESHYFALLLVPLALVRPRLSLGWIVPIAMWLAPVDHPAVWQHALTLVTATIAVSIILYEAYRPRVPHDRRDASVLAPAGAG
jgi:hypothetical protein